MNTYGLGPISVSNSSFQLTDAASENQRLARKIFVSALTVHNTVLQILGYFPGISFFSGITRVATGTAMVVGGSLLNVRKIEPNFANDLANTGIMQIFRGMLESAQIGKIFTVVFDILATFLILDEASKKATVTPA